MWAVYIGCKSNTFPGAAQIFFVEGSTLRAPDKG